MKLQILNVVYHRNGSGHCEGFMAVLFKCKELSKEHPEKCDTFVATFPVSDSNEIDTELLRVISSADVTSKWSGDHFISPLLNALPIYCKKLKVKEATWSAAAFPEQYK